MDVLIFIENLATYGRIKEKGEKRMTLTSRQKVTSLRPIYFYFVALHISNLLKNPSLFFLLQLVWIITIHLLQQK